MIKVGEGYQQLRTLEGSRAFRQERNASTGKIILTSDAIQNPRSSVDISWLPFAAEQYVISADVNDYVICDIPIVHADVPNRNLDEFPYEELTRFDPERGALVYRSFVGKPTHKDHDNKDPRKAKGVIFDASLVKMATASGHDQWIVRILAGFDRTKDRSLVDEITSGKRPGHSMGAMVNYTMCSIPKCGATSTTGKINCGHLEGSIGKGRIFDGYLAFERCYNTCFIESSSVDDAANFFATQQWAK